MMRFAFAVIVLLGFAGQAHAQAQRPAPAPALSDNAKAVLGAWEFSNSERDKICSLTLRSEPAAGGFRVEFDDRCAAAFPLVNDIVSWRMADNELLRLLDSGGKPLVEFSEVEGGLFEAPTPGYGVLFLQSASSAEPPPQTPEQVAGEWALERGGKVLCALTLTKNAAGDQGFALRVKQPCDPSVARFNFAFWRIERGELVLVPKSGDAWRFEDEEGTWKRLPVRPDGFALIKK